MTDKLAVLNNGEYISTLMEIIKIHMHLLERNKSVMFHMTAYVLSTHSDT